MPRRRKRSWEAVAGRVSVPRLASRPSSSGRRRRASAADASPSSPVSASSLPSSRHRSVASSGPSSSLAPGDSPSQPGHPDPTCLRSGEDPLRVSSARRSPSTLGGQPSWNGSPDAQDTLTVGSLDSNPGDEDSNEVILAIEMKTRGAIGCAYYVALEEALYMQEDIPMAGLDLVETLLVHVQPTTVLIPSRGPDSLADYLEANAQDVEGHATGPIPGAYVLRTISSSEFREETAKELLLNLNLDRLYPQTMQFCTVAEDEKDDGADEDAAASQKQNKLMRLGTLINLDSTVSIGCAGAVLGELQRRKAADYHPNDPDAALSFRIRSLTMLTLANAMFVNADALASLQILGSENHPNTMMQGPDKSNSGAKESLSVYGLFHFLASTYQGRMKLRKMFLRPSVDLETIRERQHTISVLLRPENSVMIENIRKLLRKIKNIKTTLTALHKGVNRPPGHASVERGTWAALQSFAAYAVNLREDIRALHSGGTVEAVARVVDGIHQAELMRVGEMITRTIDFQESKESQRTAVAQGVSEELDNLKRTYQGMEHLLTEVRAALMVEIPAWARPYIKTCIYYPQLGFLTAVSFDAERGRGAYEGEGIVGDAWQQMFVDNGVIYYKNRRMRELDKDIGDLYCSIVDKEIEMIHQLGVTVLTHEDALLRASEVCGDFDSLLALALGAARYNWAAPQMTELNVIHIKDGRHPLQELVVPSFIANDCLLAGGHGPELDDQAPSASHELDMCPSMLVLTGPNHSGKSVYIKQVALIVFLAHIGSYVPAREATIGLTDRLLTRIATRESVARSESAFAIDLRQAAFSINFATRRSLVLVDEFGKGTNTFDGAGLVTALLDHFVHLGEDRPKVIAASHFHEIFENGLLVESPALRFANLEVRLDLEAQDEDDQVVCLYHLVHGRSSSSFGTRCAAMNGVDTAVVERAETITLLLARGDDVRAACAKLSDREAGKLEEAERVARDFLEMDVPAPRPRGLGGRHDGAKVRELLGRVLAA